jgi:hypothetical protein
MVDGVTCSQSVLDPVESGCNVCLSKMCFCEPWSCSLKASVACCLDALHWQKHAMSSSLHEYLDIRRVLEDAEA